MDLGDRRLNRRLARVVEALAARPEASVPQATQTWAATKAAYRFWDNDRVRPEAIRAAHCQATVGRLPPDGTLLVVQDTTSLDLTTHPGMRGLGYLRHPRNRGLLLHTALAVTAAGVPLGPLHQAAWARDPAQRGRRARRRRRETAAKESQRWLTALHATAAALPAGRTAVTVADREADFYDLFAAPRRPGQELLIRAKGRRRLHGEAALLGAVAAGWPVRGHLEVELPRTQDRPARTARLAVRFGSVALAPPSTHPRRKELGPLPLQALLAEEVGAPAGQEPVRWLLLTTLPLASVEDALEALRWYTRRWLVERYHFVLKSGCRVERLQLETAERFQRALATYAVVAWRLLYLAYQAREEPQAAGADVLSPTEWQVLYRQTAPGQVPPVEVPGLQEVVRRIAQLGGFLARKGDGEPGVQTLWRGLRRLEDLVAGYQLAQNAQRPPPVVGNG